MTWILGTFNPNKIISRISWTETWFYYSRNCLIRYPTISNIMFNQNVLNMFLIIFLPLPQCCFGYALIRSWQMTSTETKSLSWTIDSHRGPNKHIRIRRFTLLMSSLRNSTKDIHYIGIEVTTCISFFKSCYSIYVKLFHIPSKWSKLCHDPVEFQ